MATLSEGASGSAVKKLQVNLNKLLPSGPKLKASGRFDARTTDAVTRFQKKVGLSVTGQADSATQKAIKTHIDGKTWPFGDPTSDKKSVTDAVANLRDGVSELEIKFDKIEETCRSAADLLKTNGADIAAHVGACASKWEQQAAFYAEMIKTKKAFDAAKKSYDLVGQANALRSAKELNQKADAICAKGHEKLAEVAKLSNACQAAVKELNKLEV